MDEHEASKFAEVRAEAERRRVEFIKTELKSGFAFADLARTESSLGDPAGAQQATANAMKAYNVVVKFLPKAQLSKQERQEIEGKLKELKQAIEGLNPDSPSKKLKKLVENMKPSLDAPCGCIRMLLRSENIHQRGETSDSTRGVTNQVGVGQK